MPSVFSPRNRPLLRSGRRFPIKRRVPVRMLIPNMFTLAALGAGLTAIRMAVEQRFELAIAFVLVAALLDALDGRIARLLKATSKFGAELDSLADFVNFGVAPAFIIFVWALDGLRSIGWIAVLIYAICAALRLARFNVMLEQGEGEPRWKKNYFVGMPAPAAAITVMLPLYFSQLGVPGVEVLRPLILVHVLFVALMMVSRVPTFSGKLLGGNVDRDYVAPMFVAAILFAALAFTYTWLMLVVATLAYLAIIPYGILRYRRNLAADEAANLAAQTPESSVAKEPFADSTPGDGEAGGGVAAGSSAVH